MCTQRGAAAHLAGNLFGVNQLAPVWRQLDIHMGDPKWLRISVGSAYAREKRKSDQTGLVRHTKHMGDYCRGLTAHSTLSTYTGGGKPRTALSVENTTTLLRPHGGNTDEQRD